MKLEYVGHGTSKPGEAAERSGRVGGTIHKSKRFFARFGRATAITGALIMGGAVVVPRIADAQRFELPATERLPVLVVNTLQIGDRMSVLDRQTLPYRRMAIPIYNENERYVHFIQIDGELDASVTRGFRDGEGWLLRVTFPRPNGAEAPTTTEGVEDLFRRTRIAYDAQTDTYNSGLEITQLVDRIRAYEPTFAGMKLIVERAENSTTENPILNIYAVAQDRNGTPIGRHLGGYLGAGVSVYEARGRVYGGLALFYEPGTPDPATIASR